MIIGKDRPKINYQQVRKGSYAPNPMDSIDHGNRRQALEWLPRDCTWGWGCNASISACLKAFHKMYPELVEKQWLTIEAQHQQRVGPVAVIRRKCSYRWTEAGLRFWKEVQHADKHKRKD